MNEEGEAEWQTFRFKITDFQPKIEQDKSVTIELFTSKNYDQGNQIVAVGKITSSEIKDMDNTVLKSASKFLVRWSEPAARSQWSTHQPSTNDGQTRNFYFEDDPLKPFSVLVITVTTR